MGLQDLLYAKIKEEIATDPEKVGYTGKTQAEILDLLNNRVVKQRTIDDHYPAPINRILAGLADMPNKVALQDVIGALK